MLNIIEVLFLVFGWIFNIKGLIITSLVISAFFMLISFAEEGKAIRAGKKSKVSKLALFIQIICLVMSIIKLCM